MGSMYSQTKEKHEVRQEGAVDHVCFCDNLFEQLLSFLLFQKGLKYHAAAKVK